MKVNQYSTKKKKYTCGVCMFMIYTFYKITEDIDIENKYLNIF